MEGGKKENELYKEILGSAKRVRERAAESLRRSRVLRKKRAVVGEQAEPLKGGEGFGHGIDDEAGGPDRVRAMLATSRAYFVR